jgi:hypothetical protein
MSGNDKPYDVMCYTNGLVIQINSISIKICVEGWHNRLEESSMLDLNEFQS